MRSGTLLRDVARLMRFAQDRDCLSHDLILDMTRCRGGSRGAYAVQRLFGKRFKTTFGNLRVSDVTPLFVEQQKRRFARLRPRKAIEDLDNGRWLMQWLLEDVQDAIARGAPPATEATRRSPRAKNPIDRPSGEKNGILAPSESGTSRGSKSARSRNHRLDLS